MASFTSHPLSYDLTGLDCHVLPGWADLLTQMCWACRNNMVYYFDMSRQTQKYFDIRFLSLSFKKNPILIYYPLHIRIPLEKKHFNPWFCQAGTSQLCVPEGKAANRQCCHSNISCCRCGGCEHRRHHCGALLSERKGIPFAVSICQIKSPSPVSPPHFLLHFRPRLGYSSSLTPSLSRAKKVALF